MKKFEHGGNIYAMSSPKGEWLDFSANINPMGIAASVMRVIVDNLTGIVNYPDPNATSLKKAIAGYYNIKQENILLGNGAAELFYLVTHMLTPHKVLLPVPSFAEYERATRSIGAEPVYFYLAEPSNYQLKTEDLIKSMSALSSGDMVIIGNPNNPTGTLLRREDLEPIIDHAHSQKITVIVDEAFLDFRFDEVDYSVMDFVDSYKNLIVIRSMTKFYAIPGLRLGFGVLNSAMSELLERGKDVWNVNYLAQIAGVAALNDKEYQENSRRLIVKELAFLKENLATIQGLEVKGGTVNFILLKINNGLSSRELVDKLKPHGILVRDCSNYEGLTGEYVRVAVRTHEDNQALIRALEGEFN